MRQILALIAVPKEMHGCTEIYYYYCWVCVCFGDWTQKLHQEEENLFERYCAALGMFFVISQIFSNGGFILWK